MPGPSPESVGPSGHATVGVRDWERALSSAQVRATILAQAAASIDHGFATGRPLRVDPAESPEVLREPGACFVTLRREDQLRGCIGEIGATRSLVESVVDRAFAAAFRDPRFSPLRRDEVPDTEIHVSVQGPLTRIEARHESELLRQLRPGVDGLVLTCGPARATFLPAVWASLPEPERFLSELRRKADLPSDYWSSELVFQRYPVVEVAGPCFDRARS